MRQVALNHWPVPGYKDAHWQARPFGESLEDLAVDLELAAPFATTQVLCACLTMAASPVCEDEIWSWTINRRLQGLLAVTQATTGNLLILTVACQAQACSELMDLPLRLRDYLRREDPLRLDVQGDEKQGIEIRLPTGKDQRRWLASGTAPDQMRQCLVTQSSGAPLTSKWLETIDTALTEADPLTALEVEAVCPNCGVTNRIPVDLEQQCLRMLSYQQPRLMDEIHQLALAYHWTEAEILAIPASRRRHYLDRLERNRGGEGWQ
jgi:hypothetical protein